jgi:hypothetical protein
MIQPTDLRELLQEARVELAMYRADCPAVEEDFEDGVDPVAALIEHIDAALAQPTDAKPFCWICEDDERILHEKGSCTVYEQEQKTKILAPYRQRPLYDIPQPPAGKGEPAASGRIRAWIRGAMQPSTPHGPAEYNEECVPGEDQPEGNGWMPLYFVSPDVIPRKIHERLIEELRATIAEQEGIINSLQDARWSNHHRAEAAERALAGARQDAKRYRWLAKNCIIETDLFRHDGKDPASTKHPLDNAIDAAMSSEHERGG